jgi:UDP-N-acetylmuramoylalanine--D-glutamate ligase
VVSIYSCVTLDKAVASAAAAARPGEVVLLAPACSSFDQFENYEHRGKVFKQLVKELRD